MRDIEGNSWGPRDWVCWDSELDWKGRERTGSPDPGVGAANAPAFLLALCCLSLATPVSFLWSLQVPPLGPESSSLSHWQFQPPQRLQQSNVAMLGRETVGNKVGPAPACPSPSPGPSFIPGPNPSPGPSPSRDPGPSPGLGPSFSPGTFRFDNCPLVQELSGFSLNNPSYVRSPCDPDRDNRYLTTYNQG